MKSFLSLSYFIMLLFVVFGGAIQRWASSKAPVFKCNITILRVNGRQLLYYRCRYVRAFYQ